MPCSLSLDRACRHALRYLLAENHVEHKHGHHPYGQRRKLLAVVGGERTRKLVDAQRQRLEFGLGHKNIDERELVPDARDVQHRERRGHGHAHRYDDLEEDLEKTRPVDARGLDHRTGNRLDILRREINANGEPRSDVHEEHREPRVVDAEEVHFEEERDHQRLRREEDPDDEAAVDRLRRLRFQLGEGEARQKRKKDDACRRAERIDDRVRKQKAEIAHLPRLAVVLQRRRVRQRKLAHLKFPRRLERVHDEPENRIQRHEREDTHHNIDGPPPDGGEGSFQLGFADRLGHASVLLPAVARLDRLRQHDQGEADEDHDERNRIGEREIGSAQECVVVHVNGENLRDPRRPSARHSEDEGEARQRARNREDRRVDDRPRERGQDDEAHDLPLVRPIDARGFDDLGIDLLHIRQKKDEVHARVHPQDHEEHGQHRDIRLGEEGRAPLLHEEIRERRVDIAHGLALVRGQKVSQLGYGIREYRLAGGPGQIQNLVEDIVGERESPGRIENALELRLEIADADRVYYLRDRPVRRKNRLPQEAHHDHGDDVRHIEHTLPETRRPHNLCVDEVCEDKAQGQLAEHRDQHDVEIVLERIPEPSIGEDAHIGAESGEPPLFAAEHLAAGIVRHREHYGQNDGKRHDEEIERKGWRHHRPVRPFFFKICPVVCHTRSA